MILHDKKKILFVNDTTELYGAEVSLLEMTSSLREYKPLVLLPGVGPLQQALESRNIDVLIRNFKQDMGLLKNNLIFFRLLNTVLSENSISLLHLNKPFDYIFSARYVSWIKKIPAVVHVRGKYWPRISQKILLSRFDRIICVSEYCKDYLLQKRRSDFLCRISPEKTTVIYDGKRLESFYFDYDKRCSARRKLDVSNHEIVIALIGYLNPNKGQDKFIELAYELLKYNQSLKFFIIGDTINEKYMDYKNRLLRLIEQYGLKDKCILTGFINTSDVLFGIDILVNLSKHEGLCHSVIEAMAAERVVVANAVGGIPEVIGSDGAGFLVEVNNIYKMKDIISKCADDEKIRIEIGKKAKERVTKLFNINDYIDKIEKLYGKLLSN
ncbi:MAG: glycosyltransferase family 4 protein [Candidatus Omnitrophota bacterium]|nr:glycosyltransferase family 4 protein [Candidatus Omnitrophota bacterium]